MNSTQKKRLREKHVVSEMIMLYCRDKHRPQQAPCRACADLIAYAHERSDKCPFMENKTFCSNCRVHCYRSDMRESIRAVMRYSGPRMLKTHPILAVRHLIESRIEKKQTKQTGMLPAASPPKVCKSHTRTHETDALQKDLHNKKG